MPLNRVENMEDMANGEMAHYNTLFCIPVFRLWDDILTQLNILTSLHGGYVFKVTCCRFVVSYYESVTCFYFMLNDEILCSISEIK